MTPPKFFDIVCGLPLPANREHLCKASLNTFFNAELIIITGLPSSGKTYRTQQIAEYISRRIQDESPSKRTVQIVGSHHAGQDAPLQECDSRSSRLRDEIYTTASREKTARGEEFSAVKRGVSKDTVVIADCPNYIKGYRYQLYCEAKAVGTRSCVVHVASLEDDCKRWNRERLLAWGRADEIEQEADHTPEDITKHGKDVLGNLQPESHTAVYGDRAVDQTPRSRSSSMDGTTDTAQRQQDDTMTLKSLYISAPSAATTKSTNGTPTSPPPSAEATAALPSTPIPPPTTSPPYAPTTLTSLLMRYEPPSPFSRWDTPLFTLPATDAHPPYTQIFDAIFPPPTKPTSKKALSQLPPSSSSFTTTTTTITTTHPSPLPSTNTPPPIRPNAATLLPASTSASALQTLEATTLLVVRALLAAARDQNAADGDGGVVSFSVVPLQLSSSTSPTGGEGQSSAGGDGGSGGAGGGDDKDGDNVYEITVPPGTVLSQPLLQRLRRGYTQVQRGRIAHGQGYVGQGLTGEEERRREVVRGFVGFVEGELRGG